MTEIYIISGFLGAGKTTLIQKMLEEAFQHRKVALIENDFGDVNIDASLLRAGGIEVRAMNAGCICCSLSGDFIKALKSLLERFRPEVVLVEPSGVGKLSDVVNACGDPRICDNAVIKAKITVADAERYQRYLANFGVFYKDQIQNADVIVLNRMAEDEKSLTQIRQSIAALAPSVRVVDTSWEHLDFQTLLPNTAHFQMRSSVDSGCGCHGEGHLHSVRHSHEKAYHHENDHHHEDDIFETVTIQMQTVMKEAVLLDKMASLAEHHYGSILRAKGIAPTPEGYVNLQYVTGAASASACDTAGDALCIIGQNLNTPALQSLFGGE
jgi:G3E family GTPase